MSDKPKKSKDKKQKRSNEKKGGKKGPWYRDGLRFECTQCGACCSGEPGYVWVDQSEIEAMATEIGITVEAFEGKFIREIGNLRSLIEYPDGDCILLDPRTRKCGVRIAPRSVPDMAFLGFDVGKEEGLERNVRNLPRGWKRKALFARGN